MFDKDLKSLAYVLRILAIFPLNTKLQYTFWSFSWIWSFILGITISTTHFFLEPKSQWEFIMHRFYLIRIVSYFLFPMIFGKAITNLVQVLTQFDNDYFNQFKIQVTNRYMNRGSVWIFITIFLSSLNLAIEVFFLGYTTNSLVIQCTWLYSYNFRQVWIYIYFFVCFNVKSRFIDLGNQWYSQLNTIVNCKTPFQRTNHLEYNLEQTRLQYMNLCQIVDTISDTFGYYICLYYSTISVEMISDTYYVIYFLKSGNYVTYFTYLLTNFMAVFVISWLSGEVTREVRPK